MRSALSPISSRRAFALGFLVAAVLVSLTLSASAYAAAPGDDTHPGSGTPSSEEGGPALYPAGGTGGPAPYPGGEAGASADSTPSVQTVAGSCSYRTRGDNPHRSGADVSAHGWWLYLSGSCPSQADVTVDLEQWWCDAFGCRWIWRARGSARVYAGGGSGRWANARKTCDSSQLTGWRNVVDVDLVGVSDPGDKEYVIANVNCRDF